MPVRMKWRVGASDAQAVPSAHAPPPRRTHRVRRLIVQPLVAAAYLSAKGIARDRLDSRGFGESRLKSERPDDPINRRVEARLIE